MEDQRKERDDAHVVVEKKGKDFIRLRDVSDRLVSNDEILDLKVERDKER